MLRWAIIFFVIALVAAVLGAGFLGSLAYYAAIACLVVAVIFFVLNMLNKA